MTNETQSEKAATMYSILHHWRYERETMSHLNIFPIVIRGMVLHLKVIKR